MLQSKPATARSVTPMSSRRPSESSAAAAVEVRGVQVHDSRIRTRLSTDCNCRRSLELVQIMQAERVCVCVCGFACSCVGKFISLLMVSTFPGEQNKSACPAHHQLDSPTGSRPVQGDFH